jgi:hypothetical protein
VGSHVDDQGISHLKLDGLILRTVTVGNDMKSQNLPGQTRDKTGLPIPGKQDSPYATQTKDDQNSAEENHPFDAPELRYKETI